MNRRHSFTPYRGPIESNPDCGLLPDPWAEPFTVPKRPKVSGFWKTVFGLLCAAIMASWFFGVPLYIAIMTLGVGGIFFICLGAVVLSIFNPEYFQ